MKFICDVHISLKLVKFLSNNGFESFHVNSLENKWHTKDSVICQFADNNGLIVITKDENFRNSFFLQHALRKLIRMILGNIFNQELLTLFEQHLLLIRKLNEDDSFYLELGRSVSIYKLPE